MHSAKSHPLLSILLPLGGGLLLGVLFVILLGALPTKWTVFLVVILCGFTGFMLLNLLGAPLGRFLLAAAVFSLPLLYDINFFYVEDPPFFVSANGFGITISDVFFGLLLGGWLLETVFRYRPVELQPAPLPSAMTAILGAMLAINLLSALSTPLPFFAFSLLYGQLKVYMILFYMAKRVDSENTVKMIAYVAVAILATQAVIALEQRFIGVIFTAERLGQLATWQNQIGSKVLTRVSGTLGQPNALAMFMNQFFLIAIFLAVWEKRPWRRLLIATVVLLAVVAELFTASRGGWVGFAAAVVLCTILWMLRHGAGLFTSVGLVSLVGSAGFGLLFSGSQTFRDRLLLDDMGTAEVRLPLMEVAFNMISANPLFGVGLNHYTYYMAQYDRTLDAIASNYSLPVHNTFLLIAGEVGIPALLLVIAFLVYVMHRALAIFYRSSGPVAVVSLGVFGGFISWIIHSLVDPTSFYSDYPIWIMAGLVLAMDRMTLPEKENRQEDRDAAPGTMLSAAGAGTNARSAE